MLTIAPSPLAATLKARRQNLAARVSFPVILWSGQSSPRNFSANTYPFRASSHFLYFAGLSLEKAAIRLAGGRLHLFMDESSPASALWHGATPTREAIAAEIGADEASPLADLKNWAAEAGTIAAQDWATQQQQASLLDRPVLSLALPKGGIWNWRRRSSDYG